MHQQHSKCAKQMAHNMDINSCLTNSSISSHCLFNILFQRQIRIYQRYELIHKYTVSLCNSSNSLRGHEQQQKLSEQLWAEQLCTYTNLDPFYLSLCTGSNSPRLYKQYNGTVQTALSRTAPNSVKLLRVSHDERLMNMLLVTGAAYSITLIRDLFLLTLELATVDMVVKWIDPRPGSGYLSLYSKIQRMSALIRGWRNGGHIIENLNSTLLQSTSAALGGSARFGDFLPRPPTPRGIFPWVRPLFPPSWRQSMQ